MLTQDHRVLILTKNKFLTFELLSKVLEIKKGLLLHAQCLSAEQCLMIFILEEAMMKVCLCLRVLNNDSSVQPLFCYLVSMFGTCCWLVGNRRKLNILTTVSLGDHLWEVQKENYNLLLFNYWQCKSFCIPSFSVIVIFIKSTCWVAVNYMNHH